MFELALPDANSSRALFATILEFTPHGNGTGYLRSKAEQRLRVAVRKGAQKGDEADQGRRPPVGETAEGITLASPLRMKLKEHGEAFGDQEKHDRI